MQESAWQGRFSAPSSPRAASGVKPSGLDAAAAAALAPSSSSQAGSSDLLAISSLTSCTGNGSGDTVLGSIAGNASVRVAMASETSASHDCVGSTTAGCRTTSSTTGSPSTSCLTTVGSSSTSSCSRTGSSGASCSAMPSGTSLSSGSSSIQCFATPHRVGRTTRARAARPL